MIRTAAIERTRNRARRSHRARQRLTTWQIHRPATGKGAVDHETGNWVPPTPELVYAGPAFLDPTGRAHTLTRADTTLSVNLPTLEVPHDAGPFRPGDVATCDSFPGRSWRVIAPAGGSLQIRGLLPVEEVID